MLSVIEKTIDKSKLKNKIRLNLKAKATLYSVILSVVPVMVVGVITYEIVNQSLQEETIKRKQVQANAFAGDIDRFLLNRQHELELLANRNFLTSESQISPQEKESKFKSWLNKSQIYTNLVLLDLNGNAILKTSSNAIENQAELDYFQNVVKSRKPFISQLNSSNNTEEIYFGVPVQDEQSGEIKGVLRGSILTQKLRQGISQSFPSTTKYYLLNRSDKVFFSNDTQQVGKPIDGIFLDWDSLGQSSQTATRVIPNRGNGNQALVTAVPRTDLGWRFLLSEDADRALLTPKNLLWKLFLSSSLTMLGAVLLATFVAKRILARLTTANMAVESLAQGNLSTRMPLQGKDEITSLGANINEMAAQLQQLIRERTAETEQLKKFTQALLTIRQATEREVLLKYAAQEIMTALGVERVTIYACNPDGSYEAIAESLMPGVKSLQYMSVSRDITSNRQVRTVRDIREAGYSNDLVQQLQTMHVKARAITPIREEGQVSDSKRNRYQIPTLRELPVAIVADMCTSQRDWLPMEVDFLRQAAAQLGLALERIDSNDATQALKNLAVHLSGSWRSDDIYGLAVQDIRQAFKADRVVIYQFDELWQGTFLAESVVAGFPCAMGFKLTETCLEEYVEKYRRGRVVAINNIYEAGLSQCYIQQLETFNVKANLVAPILVGNELLGLLIAHQCTRSRIWQVGEIDLFEQCARMVGLALERAKLLQTTSQARDIAEAIAQQRSDENEHIQEQILRLIDSIESAIAGDLTSRAEVGAGEIGTVADFFNAIIESLQILVIDVKNVAVQVNQAINQNAIAVNGLARDTDEQTDNAEKLLQTIAAIRGGVKATSHNAARSTQMTSAIVERARENDGILTKAIADISELSQTLILDRDRTENLSESLQQIQRVFNGIHQLAMQTNLLAINAGIEAAREGDGNHPNLPILVQEVANLANRCATAGNEIDTIAQTVYRHSSDIKSAVEQSMDCVARSKQQIMISQEKLQQIVAVCQDLDELGQAISAFMVEAVQNSHQVHRALKSTVEVSGNTSATARNIAESLQQTVSLSQELQANISNLKVD